MDNNQHSSGTAGMSYNQNNGNSGSGGTEQQQQQSANNDANKRFALAGQWRTPPLPIFPSVTGMVPVPANSNNNVQQQQQQQPQQQAQQVSNAVNLSQLPDSTEDYAKALREAYQRGAEAAKAMAAQQQQPGVMQQQQQQQQHMNGSIIPPSSDDPNAPRQQMVHPGSAPIVDTNTNSASVPNPLSMPPPPPVVSTAAPGGNSLSILPIPLANAHPGQIGASTSDHQMQTLQSQSQPGPFAANLQIQPTPNALGQTVPSTAQRSMSLPDMTTYAAQQEEEKRQKRLARNRASARLRRLRKKNLVEAYEQEVGILEKTLGQLQAHEWGETDNVAALTEALSMDRGQQVLTFEQRHQVAIGLLDQQLQWIEMLEEIMLEDYVLHNVRDGEFAELREILGLDEEQLNRIEMNKPGWEEEWTALQTLKASVIAMRENGWLWNESVSAIAEQFMAILHKNQVSKFLLWTDHNAEAIDELDGVNATPGPPNGPVFAFGVESQPGEGFGDEEK